MAKDRSNRSAALLGAALFATAYVVARGGDAHRATAIVFLLEPLLWMAAAWSVYAALTGRRRSLALALAISALASGMVVRVVRQHPSELGLAPTAMTRLRSCARSLKLPAASVRIARWHVSANEGAGMAEAVLAAEPDLVVLTGAPPETLVAALATELGGGSVSLQTPEGAAVFLGRGVFHNCGDHDGWTDVPAAGTALAFVFAGVPPEITVPILLVQSPDPLTEPSYDAAVAAEHARAAAFAGELASSLLVVLSDGTPGRGLDGALGNAQMSRVERRLNWPAQLFGVPWPLPFHAFDNAWFAPAWRPAGSRLLKAPETARHGVVFDLAPAVAFGQAPTNVPVRTLPSGGTTRVSPSNVR